MTVFTQPISGYELLIMGLIPGLIGLVMSVIYVFFISPLRKGLKEK